MELFEFLMFLFVCSYGVVFFVYPRVAFMSLPLFFPLYLWKIDLLGIPFNAIELLVIVSFALWLLKIFFFSQKTLFDRSFFREWGWLLLLALVVGLLGVDVAGKGVFQLIDGEFNSLKVALGIWKSWIMIPILYFVMFGSLLKDGWYKNLTFRAYLISSFVLAVWALWQMATGEFATIDDRASGPFVSANYLALYIAPAVLGALLLAVNSFESKKKNQVYRYAFLFFVLLLALIGSRSYGAILGVVVGGIFYFVFRFKSLKKMTVLFVSLLLLGSVFIYFQKDTEKFQKLFEFNERSSSAVRLQTWEVAGTLIKENPVFGIGLGQFPAQYEQNAERILGANPYESTQLHPHNIFLSFWLNTGILGLLFLLLIIFKVVRKIFMNKQLALLYGSLFIVVLVHGLVDQPFWKNDLSLLWWLLIGLI